MIKRKVNTIKVLITALKSIVDCKIFAIKNFSSMIFSKTCEIFCVTYVDLYLFWAKKSGEEV